MYRIETGIVTPSAPYCLQRLETAQASQVRVDYEKIKCVYGEAPAKYDGRAVTNVEAFGEQRKDVFSYDYMGSAEFEFGALPKANWIWARYVDAKDIGIQAVTYSVPGCTDSESFWIFAPNPVLGLARRTLDYIAHNTAVAGSCYGFKESLYFLENMFPNNPKLKSKFSRGSEHWDSYCGYFDIDNCCYVFWKRQDIAEAFARMWGLTSVLDLVSENADAFSLSAAKSIEDLLRPTKTK